MKRKQDDEEDRDKVANALDAMDFDFHSEDEEDRTDLRKPSNSIKKPRPMNDDLSRLNDLVSTIDCIEDPASQQHFSSKLDDDFEYNQDIAYRLESDLLLESSRSQLFFKSAPLDSFDHYLTSDLPIAHIPTIEEAAVLSTTPSANLLPESMPFSYFQDSTNKQDSDPRLGSTLMSDPLPDSTLMSDPFFEHDNPTPSFPIFFDDDEDEEESKTNEEVAPAPRRVIDTFFDDLDEPDYDDVLNTSSFTPHKPRQTPMTLHLPVMPVLPIKDIPLQPKVGYDVCPVGRYTEGKSSSGISVYFPRKKFVNYDSTMERVDLLSEPIGLMMDNVRERMKFDTHIDNEDLILENMTSRNLQKELWVDKYKPINYVDLVGDETVNRSVLSWVKEWSTKKPLKRILLLAGPPGLGKTSMVQVIARHCGFDVVEINASDDRSGDTVDRIVQEVVTAKSVFGRPKLVLIDEVDGTTTSFMTKLVKLSPKLKRPIICVCNSTLNMKELKNVCMIVNCVKSDKMLLSRRLKEICTLEGIEMDLKGLLDLVDISNGDLRSIINTLQFKSNNLGSTVASSIKDIPTAWLLLSKLLFSNTHFIAQSTKASKGVVKDKNNRNGDKTSNNSTRSVINSISTCDNLDLLVESLFENYLKVAATSRSVKERMLLIGDQLCFHDLLSKNINSNQNYSLMQYLPYPISSFNTLFSTNRETHVDFPKTFFQYFEARKHMIQISTSLHSSASLNTISTTSNNVKFITEIAPYLLCVISPPLRPTSIQTLSVQDLAKLKRTVSLFTSYNLKLKKKEETYALSPPLNLLVDLMPFCKMRKSVLDLPVVAKQLLFSKLEEEALRNTFTEGSKVVHTTKAVKGKQIKEVKVSKGVKERTIQLADLLPTHKLALKVERDFFGRIIKSNKKVAKALENIDVDLPELQEVRLERKVLYKFNEGYSNAVKRTLYIKDLLQ